jgi:hypothetical protein
MAKLCNGSNTVVEQRTHDPKLHVQILPHWENSIKSVAQFYSGSSRGVVEESTHDPKLHVQILPHWENSIKSMAQFYSGSNAVVEQWTHDPKLLVLNPATLAMGKKWQKVFAHSSSSTEAHVPTLEGSNPSALCTRKNYGQMM